MQNITLLVIDDDPVMNRIIQEIIGYLNYDIRYTRNADEGIQLARQLQPQLVLLSARIPGMDGYMVCRILKQDVKTCQIPVMFLSIRPASEDFEREQEVGADYFVSKPFLANDLAADLYQLKMHDFLIPMAASEVLRITQVMPKRRPVEEEPESDNDNSEMGEIEEALDAMDNNDIQEEGLPANKGLRHLKRFADKDARQTLNDEVISELRAIRQTTLANAYRLKALIHVLEEAGVIQKGSVDVCMNQVMRENQD
jgi:CheY-like chemotaxis protein